MLISITLVLFLIALLIGIPVAFAMGLTSLFYILFSAEFGYLLNIPQRMFISTDNFTLLAIPFFMLVGEIMNSGGITRRLIQYFQLLFGHFHGSLSYVNIGTSGFLSSIIGSSNAVAAITSSSIVPEMKKNGFSGEYSAGVSAAASVLGPIIPPSIIMIIYAVVSGISVGDLFLAGVLPGILMILAFCIVAFIYAKKKNFPKGEKSSFKTVLKQSWVPLPALMIPLGIVGGIVSGILTATEAGVIGCLLAFLIGKYIYKEIKWKDIPAMFFRAGLTTAAILLIAATANLFGWVLTIEQIPQLIGSALLSLTTEPVFILLLINIFLLILGMFLEPFAAILIIVPIFLPIIDTLGIDPVHFGLVICLNLSIGMITPPMGLSAFIVSGITKVPIDRVFRATAPYLTVSIVVLLIVTYIPQISMFLPTLLE